MRFSFSLEVQSRADDQHICVGQKTLGILLWIETMRQGRAAYAVHKVPFDLEVQELREVETKGDTLIVNMVPPDSSDGCDRIDQRNVVMTVVASNFHPFRKTIGSGDEPCRF